MKYMILIYNDAEIWDELSDAEHEAVWSEGGRKWQELVASGEGIFGEPLAAPAESHIIRVRDGVATMTDGPFAESKEQFVGFLLIDVVNGARAIEIAASWPDARYAATEVRLVNVSNAD